VVLGKIRDGGERERERERERKKEVLTLIGVRFIIFENDAL
jgi:hypothetical protein